MGKLRFKLSNVIRPHLWFVKLRDLGRRKAASLRRFAMARAVTSIYKNRKKRFLGMSKSAEVAAAATSVSSGPAKKSHLDSMPRKKQDFPAHHHHHHHHRKLVHIPESLQSPSFSETQPLIMAGMSQHSPVVKRQTLLMEMQPSMLGSAEYPEGPPYLMPEMLQSSSLMTEELQPSSSMTAVAAAEEEKSKKTKKKKRQSLITEMLSSTAVDDRQSLMTEMQFLTTERQSLMAEMQSSTTDRQSLMTEMQSTTADGQSTTANRQSLMTEVRFSTADRQSMTPERQSLSIEKLSSTTKRQSLITEKQSSSASMSPVSAAAAAMPSSGKKKKKKKKTKEKKHQQPAAAMASSSNKSKSKRPSSGGDSNSFNMDVSQIFARFTCNNTSTVASFPPPLAAKPEAAATAKPVVVQTFNYDTNKIAFCDQKKALKPKTTVVPTPYLDTKELERKLQVLRGGKELPSTTMSSESPSCKQNYYPSSRGSDSSSSISSTPEIATAGLPSPVNLDCLQSSHESLDLVDYSAYSSLYLEEDDCIQPCYSATSTTTAKHRNPPIGAVSKILSASSSGTHNSLIASYNNYSNSSDYLFLEKSGRISSTATENDQLWQATDHNRMKHASSSSLTSEGSFFTTIDETLTAVTKSFAGSSQVSTPRGTGDRSLFINERSFSGGNNNNNYTLAAKSNARRSNSKDILNKSIDAAYGSLRTHTAKSSPPPLDQYSKRMFASVNERSQLINGYSEAINRGNQFFNKSSADCTNFGSQLVEEEEEEEEDEDDEDDKGEVIEGEEDNEDNIYSSSFASSSDSDFVTTPRDWVIGKNNKSSSSNTSTINTPPPFPPYAEFDTRKSLLMLYNSNEYHPRPPPPPPSHKISRKAGTKRSVSRGLIFPDQKPAATLAPPDRIKSMKKNSRNNIQHKSKTNTNYTSEQDVSFNPCNEGMKAIKNKNKNKNNCKVFDSFAMVKCSYDPWRDFKESMVEMIMEKELHNADDLEELLHCYLSLNSDKYHDIIVEAFREVWTELLALNPSSASVDA